MDRRKVKDGWNWFRSLFSSGTVHENVHEFAVPESRLSERLADRLNRSRATLQDKEQAILAAAAKMEDAMGDFADILEVCDEIPDRDGLYQLTQSARASLAPMRS